MPRDALAELLLDERADTATDRAVQLLHDAARLLDGDPEASKRLAAVENEMRGNYQKQAEALNQLDESAGKYLEDLNSRVQRCTGQINTLLS